MNVTEKQKQIIVNFMRSHPDFGRGRLRYNRENKRKMDELWNELTTALNCAGSGPQKLPKEWAKTWRDWKSNLLKRVATYKSHVAGTGGGAPKILDTSPSEDDLLEFLTPEASGMPNIPEGGAIDDDNSLSQNFLTSNTLKENFASQSLWDCTSTSSTVKKNRMSQNFEDLSMWQTTRPSQSLQNSWKNPREMSSQILQNTVPSWQINVEEDSLDTSDVMNFEKKNFLSNTSSNVLANIENVKEKTLKEGQCINSSIKNKRCSDDQDTYKKIKKQNVKHLFEQHTSDYCNIQERMLKLKEERLTVAKEEFEFMKEAHQKHTELLTSLVEKVTELTNIMQSIAPQYLE